MITENMIHEAQAKWADYLVDIGKAQSEGRDFNSILSQMIDNLYNYQDGMVLFKPTKASEKPFRLTKESALAYFVGGNKNFPEDQGFALQPWIAVRFENAGFVLSQNFALAMGNYFFTSLNGDVIKVEYSFCYLLQRDGNLKINLHHSSLPFKNN